MCTSAVSHNQGSFAAPPVVSQGAPQHLLLLDAGLCILAASESFYTAFNVAAGQVIGKKLGDYIPAFPLSSELDDLASERDYPVAGGQKMLVSARRLSGEAGQSGMTLISIRDDSEQKRIREAAELLAQCRIALDGIGYPVIVTDLASRVTFMNPPAERLTGWSQKDALQKYLQQVFKLVDEKFSKAVESPVTRAIREGSGPGLARRAVLISRQGSELSIEENAAPILDANGRIIGVVVVFHDIASRRRSEQVLESSEVRYRRLFEAAHDGILILDAVTGKVIDVNSFMTSLLGYPPDHFLGKQLWEIEFFEDAGDSKATLAKLQKSGEISCADVTLKHKDGWLIPVEFVSNVYREGRRKVIQCNIRDITKRKLLARTLAQVNQDAEAANQAKSEFLANTSHEIRTPVSAILGFAEMLLQKSPEECSQIGCVQIIRRNALQLLELINDILDPKLEVGQMSAEPVSCDLLALLSGIVSLARPRAVEKGLGFGVMFQGPIPRMIRTDPLRLKQILVNLLGNAVKFTEFGRIDLRIMEEGTGGPNIVLRVDVIDSGVGMTPEKLAQVFRPFQPSDQPTTRRFGGAGLGLTISRQLAKLLGGDLTAVSQPRIGSSITLKIDAGPAAGVERMHGLTEATLPERVAHKEHAQVEIRGRILVVDDGDDNQRLLRMQLSAAGASVASAANGQIAVDLATTQPFDLILMDMQMPFMDGYAATRELRRRGIIIPIIALTAFAMPEDRDKCMASGCSAYLTKPLHEENLLKAVKQFLAYDHESIPKMNPSSSVSPALGVAGGSNRLKSSLADDPAMMEIIPEFVAGLPAKVHSMDDLLKSNDLPALQRIVHQLLGASGMYGFPQVSEPAMTVEQSIKTGKALESIAVQTKSLIQLIVQIDGYDETKASVTLEQSEPIRRQHEQPRLRSDDTSRGLCEAEILEPV